ncbi:thioredoxin domain-containing protein, partial [bacterium]|nr:thioredoxin domain-containing protein [bacterium]
MRALLPDAAAIAALPADGGAEFNRLVFEASPYLRQHARNPVDWYPWGPEALARAAREDKPIFLSVGYATCHWCHVMEHESFEDPATAALMNARYVCIKVDREERPDLDAAMMTATQLFTGRGGWPNSLWLTPDGRPWFCGTYFPREDRGPQRPGFGSMLIALSEIWHARRADALAQAEAVVEAIVASGALPAPAPGGPAGRDLIDAALSALAADFDPVHGGFGGAPKFPPHQALTLLMDEHARSGDETLLRMATRTLEAMAAGGIHDQLGGGFHRYSTDARWLLPH